MTTLEHITQIIKTNPAAKAILDKAIYWQGEAARVDYINKPVDATTAEDIEIHEIVYGQFLHYFDQLGITWDVYTQLKNS